MEIPPIIHPRVNDFLESEESKVFDLIEGFGSALHLVFPSIIEQNVQAFQETYKEQGVNGSILYASKANKSEAILEMISRCKLGADVSSLNELRNALAHGIQGRDIGISGATKDIRLLLLALQHECTIAIDSIRDLQNLFDVHKAAGLKTPAAVLLRINDLMGKTSRFGINLADLPVIYELLKNSGDVSDLRGFSFHLDGYSVEDRVNCIVKLLEKIEEARRLGFNCDVIDIGGGFTVSYVDESVWQKFSGSMAGDALQFYRGKKPENLYPYHNENPKEKFLKKILENRSYTAHSVATLLKKHNIALTIEPGRSLLDQAGITLVKVKDVKTVASGENVVIVEANINSLSEQWFNSEFLPDPKHLQASPGAYAESLEAAVGGNTCLEIDMLNWRKIGFKNKPVPGDILAYINTAGYQMDTNESEFHGLPLPEKIAVFSKQGRWQWKRDSQFSQLDL